MSRTFAVACIAALAVGACRTPEAQVAPTTALQSQDLTSLRLALQRLGSGNGIPEKFDGSDSVMTTDRSRFEQVPQDHYLRYRDLHRRFRVICETRDDPRYCSRSDNLTHTDSRRLLAAGTSLVDDVEKMQELALFSGKSTYQPWSTGNWLVSDGLTAYRYTDPAWPASSDWSVVHAYANQTNDPQHRSPAEKYDLAMAAAEETLMQSQWALGQPRTERPHDPVAFHDIAHGWAAASVAMPRPTRSVPVQVANGETVVFHPEDIKALGSLLWAHSRYPIRYIGGPCLGWEEARNAQVRCQTFDAATFHLALVNTIGVAKEPLIMDATLDPDIFHRPVIAYEMNFFSIGDQEIRGDLSQAKMPLPILEDPWASQRSDTARYAVGVAATLTYVNQRRVVADEQDSIDNDELLRVTYFYDLEFDDSGKILGGFWYQEIHPDFLWRPEPQQAISTWGDSFVRGDWTYDQGELPWSWKKGGEYDARSGKPLGKFVTSLFDVASGVNALPSKALPPAIIPAKKSAGKH